MMVGKLSHKPAKSVDNFINDKVYWKSIKQDKQHTFKTFDYIYRWDTDLYYTSINDFVPKFLMNRTLRRMVPQSFIIPIRNALPHLGMAMDTKMDFIVQDVLIPFKNIKKFYEFYDKESDYILFIFVPVKLKLINSSFLMINFIVILVLVMVYFLKIIMKRNVK